VLAGATRRNVLLAVVTAGALTVLLSMLSSCVSAAFRAAVPDLTNMAPAQATHALVSAGLVPGAASYVHSSVAQSGTIAQQSPAPLARVGSGTQVTVKIAVGRTTVPVPDVWLAGQPDAELLLSGLGLATRVIGAYSQEVPVGRVLEQLPRAGASADGGETVVLVVSLGPGTSGKSVPRVVGRNLSSADALLGRATLVADVRPKLSGDATEGTVLDQVPAAGTRVGVASRVVLAVAARR
jgi:eukaryotic-like serine/threonine-protein kinase